MLAVVPLVPLWVLVGLLPVAGLPDGDGVGVVRCAVGARGAPRPAAYVGRGRARRLQRRVRARAAARCAARDVELRRDVRRRRPGRDRRTPRTEPGAAARRPRHRHRPDSGPRVAPGAAPRPPAGGAARRRRARRPGLPAALLDPPAPPARLRPAGLALRHGDRRRLRVDPRAGDPGDPVAAGARGRMASSPSATRSWASAPRCSRSRCRSRRWCWRWWCSRPARSSTRRPRRPTCSTRRRTTSSASTRASTPAPRPAGP